MGNGDHVAFGDSLSGPSYRRVHFERAMNTVAIVVFKVLFQNPTEMAFAEDDCVVQAFSADAAVESL